MNPKAKKIMLLSTIITFILVALAGMLVLGGKLGNMGDGKNGEKTSLSTNQEQAITLGDLLNSAEKVMIPNTDTNNWKTYKAETLGVEFKLPDGWKINERILSMTNGDTVCISTLNERYSKVESSGECSIQLNVDKEKTIDSYISGFDKWKNQYYPSRSYDALTLSSDRRILSFNDGVDTFFSFVNNDRIVAGKISNEDKQIPEILNVYYGVLQTLKPIE